MENLKVFSNAHIVSLLYEIITSAKNTKDFSIGFDRDSGRRQEALTKKNSEKKYHLRIMLRDVFGFAELQEKGTYGLGYKLSLT